MSWAVETLGPKLLVKRDDAMVEKPTEEVLAGKKFVALYFSAQWCGPCRKFTPFFSVCYEDMADKDEVEVIFISNDNDLDGFTEYYEEMPWAALPYQSEKRENLAEQYGVSGLPTVLVLNAATGALVDKDARAKITAAKKLNGVWST